MLVSMVIINDDESLYLRRFFGSIDEKWKERLDFIFVDNCSCDNPTDVAGSFGIEKIVTFKMKPDSIAALYNAALEKVGGEYILFVHSDVIFSEGFFERLWRRLAAGPPDVMNFQVYYADKSTKAESAIYWNAERHEIYNMQLWGETPAGGFRRIILCSDCCFLVKAELARLERFNETYRNNFFIHEFMLRQRSDASTDFYDSRASVEHYFIERHKQLKSIRQDENNFVKNNLSVLLLPETGDMFNRESYIAGLEEKLRENLLSMDQVSNAMQRIQGALPGLEKVLIGLDGESISSGLSVSAGELCYSLDLLDSAKKFFEKAIRLEPGNADAYNNLGVLEIKKGDLNSARNYFMKALSVAPDCEEAKINIDILSQAADAVNASDACSNAPFGKNVI